MTIAFTWMGRTCTVDAPPAVAEAVSALFPTLAGPAGSTHAVDVRVVAHGSGLVVDPYEGEPCPTLSDAVSVVELAVTNHLLSADRLHSHLHAAGALAENGEVMLVLGASGSGKSTMAYAWYRAGRPVLGDDVVALDAEGRVHPFPRPLKVDAVHLRNAGEAPERTVAWDPAARDVWVDPTRRAGWAPGGLPVCLVAQLRFEAGAPTRVEEVAGGERLRILLDSVHPTGTSRVDGLDRLIAVAERSAAYRVEYGNAVDMAAGLLALAGSRPR